MMKMEAGIMCMVRRSLLKLLVLFVLVFSHCLLVRFHDIFFHDTRKSEDMGWLVGRAKDVNPMWGKWVVHTKEKTQQTAMREVDLPLWSSTKPGRQKITTFCFVALGRHLSAIVTPLLTYPWIVVFRLTCSLSLSSQVSPFTFMLTCLSSIAMGTKGIWWELDGNKRNFMRILWELDENKRILMGYWWEQEELDENFLRTWWEQKEFDWNLMGTKGTWLKLDGNKRILMCYWWEQEEFDENCLGSWWEQKDFDEILMGTRGIRLLLFGDLMGNHPPLSKR